MRLDPGLKPHQYSTYQMVKPTSTHFKPATCQEVDCGAYLNGWKTVIDVNTELGKKQANYIRLSSGRHFTVEENGTVVTFIFPAGQQCFTKHQAPIERDPIFLRRGGDWRGNPTGRRQIFANVDDWGNSFKETHEKINDILDRG